MALFCNWSFTMLWPGVTSFTQFHCQCQTKSKCRFDAFQLPMEHSAWKGHNCTIKSRRGIKSSLYWLWQLTWILLGPAINLHELTFATKRNVDSDRSAAAAAIGLSKLSSWAAMAELCRIYLLLVFSPAAPLQARGVAARQRAELPLHLSSWKLTRIPGTSRPGPAGSASTTSCYGISK